MTHLSETRWRMVFAQHPEKVTVTSQVTVTCSSAGAWSSGSKSAVRKTFGQNGGGVKDPRQSGDKIKEDTCQNVVWALIS